MWPSRVLAVLLTKGWQPQSVDHGGKTTQLKFESSRNVKDLCGSVAIRNKNIQDLMIFDMFCGEKSVYNAFRPGP